MSWPAKLQQVSNPAFVGEHLLAFAFACGMAALCLCIGFLWTQSRLLQSRFKRDEEAARQWSRRVADATFDGLLVHRNGTIVAMNRALLRMLQLREREMLGQAFAALAPADDGGALRNELEAPGSGVVELRLLRADKSEVTVELFSQPTQHDQLPATISAIRDVTEARADRARAERLLNYDSLTGLANRKMFLDRLRAGVAANDAVGGATALFVLDLDHFKQMNEQFGRNGGDTLLRQLSAKLAGLIDPADALGRISGDTFAIMQSYRGAANRAMALASRLESAFTESFLIDGQMVRISVSIGLAIYPDHATDAEALLKAASFALGLAAAGGGGTCHVFAHAEANAAQAAHETGGRGGLAMPGLAGQSGKSADEQKLKKDLRAAIPGGQISLDYQPIFHARDLQLAGFEALCRWRHPEKGLIPPVEFIPLAEQAGLIHELGAFVLESACTEAAGSGKEIVMAVNLSPLQFRDPQLPQRITNILRKTGLRPDQLELEVTESLLIDNAAAARAALTTIREIGVSVALDDFGTGFSSLSYLSDFPFNRLKIDRKFTQALGREPNAEAIIGAIVSLAHSLRLEVTAEGVETPGQLAFLQEQGCHLVQGFLLGRPMASIAAGQPMLQKMQAQQKPSLTVAHG
jgi:diguanylate cyclase (GGDEF)-like protein/PAS domain S-box-containing protein